MSLIGADVTALRHLATTYDSQASALESAQFAIAARLSAAVWVGPNADDFHGHWVTALEPGLVTAATALTTAATTLRANADAQEAVSNDLDTSSAGWTVAGVTRTAGAAAPTSGGPGGGPASGPTSSVKPGLKYDPETGLLTLTISDSSEKSSTTAGGSKITVGVTADAEYTSGVVTKDGFTTYTNKTDISISDEGGIEKGGYGLEGSSTKGMTAEHTVKVPENSVANLANVNPFDPSTMPPGSSVTMRSSDYGGTALEATFKHIALESGRKEAEGMSTVIEKLNDSTVRITAGPTEGVENVLGLGIKAGDLKASLAATHSMESGLYRSAELDLSTPEGLAAYNEYLLTGELPKTPSTGISGTTETFVGDYTYTLEAGIETPFLDLSTELGSKSQSTILTTYPDGSTDIRVTSDRPDDGKANFTTHLDPSGTEDVSARTYTLTLTPDEADVQFFNNAGKDYGMWDGPVINPGQTVQLTLTESQMIELRDSAYTVGNQRDHPATPYTDWAVNGQGRNSYPKNTIDFYINMNNGSDSNRDLLTNLYNIASQADGDPRNGVIDFPGTVTVVK